MKTTAFKNTDIGPIPEDWEVKSFESLWKSFRTGPFGSSLHAQDYVESGIPIVNPMHIVDGCLHPSEEMGVSATTAKRLNEYRLSEDDIIIGRRGEMGRAALIQKEHVGWLCGTGCFFLHLKETECPDYIARSLRTPNCVSFLESSAVGTTLVNLNQRILGSLPIALPPLPEQRRIAAALSDADELVASLDKLIEKKKRVKEGAMQRLLSGKTRLPGFTGKWVEKSVEEIIDKISTGLNPRQNFVLNNGGSNYYVTIKDFKDGELDFSGCDKIDDAALQLINARSDLRVGDILFSSIGRIGDAYVVKETPTNWNVNESVFVLHPANGFDSMFLYYLIKSEAFQKDLKESSTGTTMTGIKVGHLEKIVCTLPIDCEEQCSIAAVLSDMDAEIAALSRERAEAERIKQGMMQELLTGKTRLAEGGTQ